MQNEIGQKNDAGKLRYDLIPVETLESLAEVLTFGANKYTDNSWQAVAFAEDRYYAALLRHLIAWRKGESHDPESGLHHLKHVLANAAFLQFFNKSEDNNG